MQCKYINLPKIVYLRSKCGCASYEIKNCDPLELGPLFAILTTPLAAC